MNKVTVKIRYEDDFNIPHLPKFITRPDGTKVHIKTLPDKAIKVIADTWAKEFIAKAKKEREGDTLPLPLDDGLQDETKSAS